MDADTLLEQYRQRHQLASRSAAIRQLIDAVSEGCEVCGLPMDQHDCLRIRELADLDVMIERTA